VSANPAHITRDLLRCPSVTPAEGGALAFLEKILKASGFTVHRMTFSEPGADDVENFYARIGTAAPNLVFAGHTDVVPPGDEKAGSIHHFPARLPAARCTGAAPST
jgi:succinyl-diaminopimelate desuccinylase